MVVAGSGEKMPSVEDPKSWRNLCLRVKYVGLKAKTVSRTSALVAQLLCPGMKYLGRP